MLVASEQQLGPTFVRQGDVFPQVAPDDGHEQAACVTICNPQRMLCGSHELQLARGRARHKSIGNGSRIPLQQLIHFGQLGAHKRSQ